jgi:hypothetical protein
MEYSTQHKVTNTIRISRGRFGRSRLLSNSPCIQFKNQSSPPSCDSPTSYTASVPSTLHLWVLLNKLHTLGNVALEILQASIHQLLLILANLAHRVNLLDTLWSKLNLTAEKIDTLVLVQWALHECALYNTRLTGRSLEERLGETSTGHGHGEGGRSSSIFGLDDFVTAKLHALDVLVKSGAGNVAVAGLGEQWNDCGAGVTTNDGDMLISRVSRLHLADEARGTDDVEGGDTKEALGVVGALGLEDFGANRDGGVDLRVKLDISGVRAIDSAYWVGDDQNVGVWRSIGNSLCEITDNRCVGVEQIFPASVPAILYF